MKIYEEFKKRAIEICTPFIKKRWSNGSEYDIVDIIELFKNQSKDLSAIDELILMALWRSRIMYSSGEMWVSAGGDWVHILLSSVFTSQPYFSKGFHEYLMDNFKNKES